MEESAVGKELCGSSENSLVSCVNHGSSCGKVVGKELDDIIKSSEKY
jgi:hypothetical protein